MIHSAYVAREELRAAPDELLRQSFDALRLTATYSDGTGGRCAVSSSATTRCLAYTTRVLVDAAASLARSQLTAKAQRSNFRYFALRAPFGASVRRVDLATDGTIEVIIDGDAPAAVERALYCLADEQAVPMRVARDFAPRSP